MSSRQLSRRFPVIASIVVSLTLAIAPLPEWAEAYRPDWVALTLIYWSLLLPKTYSVGWAWLAGLVLDIAQGTLFGQHALQIRVFPMLQKTVTVFAILALYQFILFWINGVAGINSPSVTYWGPVLTGTVIWPLLSLLYGNIRYRTRSVG